MSTYEVASNYFSDGGRRVVGRVGVAMYYLSNDGTGWQSVNTGLTGNRLCRGLWRDASGFMNFIYTSGSFGFHATNASGSWASTSMGITYTYDCASTMDANGKLHVIFASSTPAFAYLSNVTGAWASESLAADPTGGNSLEIKTNITGVPYVLYQRRLARKVSGVWTIDTSWNTAAILTAAFALADDTGRPVVAYYNQTLSSYAAKVSDGTGWSVIGSSSRWLHPKLLRTYVNGTGRKVEVVAYDNTLAKYVKFMHGAGATEDALDEGGLTGWIQFFWDRVGRIRAVKADYPVLEGVLGSNRFAQPWTETTSNVYLNYDHAMTALPNGRVAVATTALGGLQVYQRATTDAWTSTAVETLLPDRPSAPSIVANNTTGQLHVLYRGDTTGDLKYATKPTSSTWTVSLVLATNDTGMTPRLAIDNLGSLHGTFRENGAGLRYVTNHTGGWTYVLVDSTAYSLIQAGSIWVDASNNVYVAYRRQISGSIYDMRYRRKSRTAGTWAVTESIDGSSAQNKDTRGFMNPQGLPAVVYSDNGLRYRWRAATGWSVGNEELIDPSVNSLDYAGVDPRGRIWVSYQRSDGTYVAARDATGWFTSRMHPTQGSWFILDSLGWGHGLYLPTSATYYSYWFGQVGDLMTIPANRVSQQ